MSKGLDHKHFGVASANQQREVDAEYAAVEADARAAFKAGKSLEDNPWRPRSFKSKLWEKAYLAALSESA